MCLKVRNILGMTMTHLTTREGFWQKLKSFLQITVEMTMTSWEIWKKYIRRKEKVWVYSWKDLEMTFKKKQTPTPKNNEILIITVGILDIDNNSRYIKQK